MVLFPASKLISKSDKALVTVDESDLHQNNKKSRPADPTRKPRVGWRQKNNFLSPVWAEMG